MLAKVEAICEFPPPRDHRGVKRFVGMAGWYRRYCPNFVTVVLPLTELLAKDVKFVWSDRCQSAFESVKHLLMNYPVLRSPDFDKQFKIQVDSCDTGIGSVLLQEDEEGVDHPVCYHSRKLDSAQRNYSTVEKECLAIVMTLKHFEVYLSTTKHPILVFTDHNPLVFLDRMKTSNQRLLRWSLALQEYDIQVLYIKGKDNVIADALSRAC